MKMILGFLKDYKKECVLAPLFKMLEALFELFVPLVVSSIIDIGIGQKDVGYIVKMCMMLLGLAVIGLVCSITAQYFSAKAAVGGATGMRHALFSHIQSLSFTELDTVGTSTLITRMTSDINQVQNGVNLVLRLFLRSPFIVFGAMIMAFTIDVKAALVFVCAIPVLAVIVFGIMLSTRPLYKKVQAGLDKILGITRENLTGVRVIRAFNKEQTEVDEFKTSNEALNHLQKYVGKISGLMNPLTYVVVNVSIIALIWIGAIRVNSGSLTQGQVVALYNYMSQILVELIKLANLVINITKALACAGRIQNVFDVKSSMADGKLEIQTGKISENVNDSENAVPAVEFRNVALKYEGAGDDSITGVDFKAMKGQTIGIIGGTGSGKSTLVGLIPRFYDATCGQVLIDGHDVKDISIDSLRQKVAIVMQKAVLFKGTIRENMQMGKEDATDAEIMEALEVAQAKEFVDKKDGKLDALVEQGGKNLSGGQRQRLTIARAVVRKPDILILDDSASALDFATDAALRKSIRNMKNSPTVFIVSQRAASLMYADLIIALDDGKVAGMGTHDELLKNCEVYREIYNSQFKK
ncbi:MAG: ABC transporter ATP-binding protein/permease [Lachnospira sp.]|nr:ABC transporter ATP-binding protein/permease [Lachnospira sp.]MDD5828704.1 ABC transporter ATP-binding protein [Lachnospira sp.]